MSNRVRNIWGFLFCSLILAQPALAIETYSSEQNEFVKPALKSGYDEDDDERNELETHISSSTRYHDTHKGFDFVTTMRPGGEEGSSLPPESEDKKTSITHQLPLQGQQMLQNSEAIRDMLDTGLDGVMTLFKITAHQTEPAEAAGAQGAEVIAALLQNNMYQSQNLMHLQYIADPNMYRTSMAMYSNCMTEKTEAYTTADSGSWIKALAECLGDGVATGSAAVTGPASFATNEDSAYQPEYHPAMKVLGKTDEELKLTDLLFNELESKAGGGGLGGLDAAKVQALKDSWTEMFGDKILKYEVTDTSTPFFPIRKGTVVRIAPTDRTTGQPHTIQDMVRARADKRFDTIREILHFHCLGVGSGLLGVVPFGSAPTKIHADEEEYWTTNSLAFFESEKEVLSLPGQPMRIVILQGLYDNYKQRFGDRMGQVDCTVLDPGSTQIEDLSQFSGLGNAVYLEFFSHIRAIARKIAQAQLLIAGIFAQDFVNDRASGFGLDPDIRDMALQMISETFNGHGFNGADLREQLEITTQGFNELVAEIFKQRTKVSGKAASIATTGKGRTEK